MPIAQIAYTREQIDQRVRALARELDEDLRGTRPLLVSVLKGSVIFLADLVRQLPLEPDIDFMSITSYGDGRGATGVVRIVKDLEEPLEGRNVVIVEDIVDTGLSLSYLLRTLLDRNPESVRVCALIDKGLHRIAEVDVDYVGFRSESFLVGYGLDYQGRYRNLPYLLGVTDLPALAANPDLLLEETELFWSSSG